MSKKKNTTDFREGQAKILYFDIETAPNLAHVWAQWEQNVLWHEREWYMLCYSYQWGHNGKTHVVAQDDFPDQYKADPFDDSHVLMTLWDLFNEADIIIGHNLDKFDVRKAKARFIELGLEPPSPWKTIDTLKVARKEFYFNSNRLGDLCRKFGIGHKHETGGLDLWKGCLSGDKKSWAKMKKYAKQDTALLPGLYQKMRAWMTTHHSMNIYGRPDACPRCGDENATFHSRGKAYTKTGTFNRYQCQTCKGYCRERLADKYVRKPEKVV